MSWLDEAVYEGLRDAALFDSYVCESVIIERPRDTEENIARGKAAMRRVIDTHAPERKAMWREGVEWIGFEWGRPGETPPAFDGKAHALAWWKGLKNKYLLFKGGYGVAHIVAKRDWEGKYIKELIGQKGEDVAMLLPEVIAKGIVNTNSARNSSNTNNEKIEIRYNGIRAILGKGRTKQKGSNDYWIVSGYKIQTQGYKFIYESADEHGGKPPPFPCNSTDHVYFLPPYGTQRMEGAAPYEKRISLAFANGNIDFADFWLGLEI